MRSNNALVKNILLFFLVLVTLGVVFSTTSLSGSRPTEVDLTKVAEQIKKEEVQKVEIRGNELRVFLKSGEKEKAVKESDGSLISALRDFGVEPEQLVAVSFEVKQPGGFGYWLGVLLPIILPFLLIATFIYLMMRQVQGQNMRAMMFGQSSAREIPKDGKNRVTFKDVAGANEAKDELAEVVDFLKNPKKFSALGAKIPKGVLLMGSPGTGKTLLARAVAGEAGVPFFTSSGSEFVEMFVGVGASRVRDLFAKAKKSVPCIVFIDEIDAVGRQRGTGLGGSHDEREQTLNQMLVELDGFESKEGIILIGATNRPDVLDTALLRPGRFDRRINVPVPDIKGRLDILNVHAKKIKLTADTDLNVIARHTPGFTGADLANIVNEGAIIAAKKEQKSVDLKDLEEAIEKSIAGPQRKSRIISDSEKRVVAYHEAGHTLVAKSLPGCDPVHKVTIIPRGPALGYTLQMPIEDKYLTSKTDILNRLCVLLGGRAAEEIAIGEITTGAHDDLNKVTSYAQKMVMEFGMSDKIGLQSLKKDESEVFLGRDIMRQAGYSNETARIVDEEIKRIISDAYMKAKAALTGNRRALDAIANRLIETEVVDAAEIDALIAAAKAPAPTPAPKPA